ncbi:MAG: acetyl-CoA carboxylase biotin carboxyl carrier protein subunit [Clostridia bacterium]|nr:acetyl-CoA carboxylase biotin carboxyl carrier protein subunit [Clostridia bacterium]
MGFNLEAHMPGLVARVTCEVGQEVEENQELVVLNCMKTEISCLSPKPGRVKEIMVAEWDEMDVGIPMIKLEEL